LCGNPAKGLQPVSFSLNSTPLDSPPREHFYDETRPKNCQLLALFSLSRLGV
jgi:hypothetical protein